jgi:sigma-B regulation protein RsbU (phosphoserine phosphatase)
MILGVMQTVIPYLSEVVQLQSGDAIVLFTDGITEAMNDKWEEYSDERLEELVLKKYQESSNNILSHIRFSVEDFTHGAEQSDDITCLVIKVK